MKVKKVVERAGHTQIEIYRVEIGKMCTEEGECKSANCRECEYFEEYSYPATLFEGQADTVPIIYGDMEVTHLFAMSKDGKGILAVGVE
jgi:hypothetical protein